MTAKRKSSPVKSRSIYVARAQPANCAYLKGISLRGGFKALGRVAAVKETRAWYPRQHKKRASRMEGIIGLGKNRSVLGRAKYRMPGGEGRRRVCGLGCW